MFRKGSGAVGTKERILTLRLLGCISKQPAYAQSIGIEVRMEDAGEAIPGTGLSEKCGVFGRRAETTILLCERG